VCDRSLAFVGGSTLAEMRCPFGVYVHSRLEVPETCMGLGTNLSQTVQPNGLSASYPSA
jgi:hypothetical protein